MQSLQAITRLSGAFLGLSLAFSSLGQPSTEAGRLRGLNDEVVRLHEAVRAATPRQSQEIRKGAVEAIARRAAAMAALIENNPAEALSLAFPRDVVSDLATRFPESAGDLETQGTWEGPSETWVMDSPDGTHRSITRIRTGSEILDVSFAGVAPSASCQSGDTLQVAGIRLGNTLAASSAVRRPSTMAATTSSTPAACTTTGPQNTVVFLVTFPGITPPSTVTPQSVHDIYFGTTGHSLDGYLREASYGQTWATGNVYGWYTLSQAYTCSALDQALAEAMGIASAAGASFPNGTRFVMIYPKIGCVSGSAQVGCSSMNTPSGTINGSTAYIEADYMTGDQGVYFAVHEGGHNLGLQHAGTLSYGTETLGSLTSTGTVDEYNDDFSVMGSQMLGHYSAQHKAEILGWLASGYNYQVVQNSGTWTLQPFETGAGGLMALKVQRGTGNGAWLWIEYRQPVGTYDSTLYFQQPAGGAFIHYEDPTVGAYTHILNFAPQLNSWYAPALLAGQTWVDPYTNVSIAVQSATSTAMTVNVTYGSTPCTHANPSVVITPPNPSAYPGGNVSYTVTLTNNDSSGCSSGFFSLASSQPTGWWTGFSPASLTLNPGQSGSVTMTKTVPAGAVSGVYTVDATGTAGTMAGSGSANATVTIPSLAVSVSTPASTYRTGQTVPLTALVSYNGSPAAGASVTFTLTQPNGSKSAKVLTTGTTGKAVWNYKIGPKGPKGVYSFSATASYGSQTSTSISASFTVQ